MKRRIKEQRKTRGRPSVVRKKIDEKKIDQLIRQLGKIMKKERKEFGLSQEKVGKRLGISKATLSEIESGHIKMSVHRLLSWCETLHLSPIVVLKKLEQSLKPKEERKQEYKRIIDVMFELGLDSELDMVFSSFRKFLHLK